MVAAAVLISAVVGSALLGRLASMFKQPIVLGSMVWGILSATAFHGLAPSASAVLADSHSLPSEVGNLGLILVVAAVAHSVRALRLQSDGPTGWVRHSAAIVVAVAGPGILAATVIFGLGTPQLLIPTTLPSSLFLVLAVSVTAVPVLASIVREAGISDHVAVRRCMTVSILTDGVAWLGLTALLLATVSATSWDGGDAIHAAILALAGAAGSLVAGSTVSVRVATAAIIVSAVSLGYAADIVGAHPSIGAAIAGISMRPSSAVAAAFVKLEPWLHRLLLPIFIVVASAHAPLQLLGQAGVSAATTVSWLLGLCLFVKFVPGIASGIGFGMRTMDCFIYSSLLNCRGVTELVIASIGLRSGLLTPVGFACLAIVALISTVFTGPVAALARLSRKTCVDSPQPLRR
ncbi:cation:proton antiporter [Rhodococcus sp. IEGM 1381]|uniref:cation:proton antiporter n=1 Tax=Rhodococcus sp. IEGM 1381 TaxID=3047085 RepID=UPI0024B645E5|nr:cation:proton antiporter [Rhodococcus sp. IEGM 1381]MDI9894845.1 cation:proton antiporter [Rhodococcus sp. IEGM 1381]